MQTYNKSVRSTDTVKAVVECLELSIDSTVQQIVNILLNIVYKTTTGCAKSLPAALKYGTEIAVKFSRSDRQQNQTKDEVEDGLVVTISRALIHVTYHSHCAALRLAWKLRGGSCPLKINCSYSGRAYELRVTTHASKF